VVTPDADVLEHARTRLAALLGDTPGPPEPVGGWSNRLYRLAVGPSRVVLLKHYVRDDRDRLRREFAALRFLRPRLGDLVPEAILADPERNYGLYSFEAGAVKRAAELTAAEVDAMAGCAAALHAFAPDADGCPDFPPAAMAAFAVDEILPEIEACLTRFEAFAPSSPHEAIRALAARVPVRAGVGELVARALEAVPAVQRSGAVPRSAWRLSNCDFAPHNILVRPNGGVCAVDWEYAGWDDPARFVIGFVTHATSLSLPPPIGSRFLRTYAERRGLSQAEFARIQRLRLLNEVEWATVHLNALDDASWRRHRHAHPDRDPQSFFATQIAAFERRLARCRDLLA
jgi:hypothetical protein